jgi:hypothetical protein
VNRDQALRGVDQRIGALWLAHADPPVTGVPIAEPVLPAVAFSPSEPRGRVYRAVTLRIPPGVDVFALFADDWQRSGFQPRWWPSPHGPVLVAHDQANFTFLLQQHGEQIELYVVSPPLSSVGNGMLFGGLAAGAMIGLVGPCFSVLALNRVHSGFAFLAYVPFAVLLAGGLLIAPSTRRFGLGLLIGGAVTGIATAGICAPMLR